MTNPRGRINRRIKNKDNLGTQRASEDNDETGHRGLHTFYETIAHESEHIVIWEEIWPGGVYVATQDTDNDFYRDDWERQHADIGGGIGFEVGRNDDYTNGVILPGQISSVGYIYEETRCRQVEHNLIETAFDNLDWSYDTTNINQGKQWNR